MGWRRASSSIGELPKKKNMEWSFTTATTGGLKSTLNLLDPGLYAYDAMPTAKLCWLGGHDLTRLHLVIQVGQGRPGQARPGQARPGRAGQARAGQGRAGQGRAGHEGTRRATFTNV